MASSNEATHFCSHPNGKLTTMVCVDDLPADFVVEGAPRTITPAETQGMTSCGVVAARSEPWKVHSSSVTKSDLSNAPIEKVFAILNELVNDVKVPVQYRTAVKDLLVNQETALIVSPLNGTRNNARNSQGASTGGLRGKKEYCSYWIRHGECDYQQQGCLFKHEMPLDAAMLESLGLRDIPRWYREKYGVPSLLRSGRGQHALPAGNTGTPKFRAIGYYGHDEASNPGSYHDLTPVSNNSGSMHGSRNGNGRKNWRPAASNKRINNDPRIGFGYDNGHAGKTGPPFSAPLPDVSQGNLNSPAASSESFVIDLDAGINSSRAHQTPDIRALEWPRTSVSSIGGGVPIPVTDESAASVSGALVPAPRIHALGRLMDNQMPRGGSPFPSSLSARLPHLGDNQVNLTQTGPVPNNAGVWQPPSRRLYDLGFDGSKSDKGDIAQASQYTTSDGDVRMTPSSGTFVTLTTMRPMLRQLVDESNPITPWDALFDFGPIGEDVIYPCMIEAQLEPYYDYEGDSGCAVEYDCFGETNEMSGHGVELTWDDIVRVHY